MGWVILILIQSVVLFDTRTFIVPNNKLYLLNFKTKFTQFQSQLICIKRRPSIIHSFNYPIIIIRIKWKWTKIKMFVVQTFIRHNVFRMSFECLQVTIEHLKKKNFFLIIILSKFVMFINLFNGFKLLQIKTHFIMGQS